MFSRGGCAGRSEPFSPGTCSFSSWGFGSAAVGLKPSSSDGLRNPTSLWETVGRRQ